MAVRVFTLGPFQTNCLLVSEDEARDGSECLIVDASFGPAPMIAEIRGRGLRPTALVLTHAHVDHIAGVSEIRSAFPDLPVLMHEAEAEWLNDPLLNLSEAMGMSVTAPGPDQLLREGDVVRVGGSSWRVLHTPGHSPGGLTLVCDAAGIAIVGDTLFAGSIGRTDFPGSDHETLARSIREKLYTLPGGTKVYPGHGPPTTISREMMSNPYIRAR
jgi:glyoxylase-like metal-dependent hydrolase (beta-lactamase superfamily II)